MSTAQYKLPVIPEPKGLPESKKKLDELLEVNHRKYNISYMDDRANHIPHALCSLYALGATPEQIEKFNDYFATRLEPLPTPKFTIDEGNWESHIGNRCSYPEFLDYFDRELKSNDLMKVFKKYIPRLIPGLTAIASHPLIHIGYAIEFNSKTVMSEGLAYICMGYDELGNVVDKLDARKAKPKKSARELLESIDLLNPPDFLQQGGDFDSILESAIRMFTPQMMNLLNQWEFNPRNSQLLYEKTVDLTVASVLAFCGSYSDLSPDFFYAHGVTGNHAIRTMLPHLEPEDQRRLLQIGFLTMIVLYFTRGRVEFDENYVFKNKNNSTKAQVPTETMDWNDLIKISRDSKDDHLIKVVRSLDIIQKTIVEKRDVKYPNNINIEAARLVVATVGIEADWFATSSK